MKKISLLFLSLLTAVSLPALAQNAATVNGKAIPASHVNVLVNEAIQAGQPDTLELRNEVKETLIMREILVQEADKKKLGTLPLVKAQIEIMRRNVLIRALMSDFAQKNPISDAEIKKEYDRLAANAGKTEYLTSHILVKSEDEAKAIIEQLNKGGKFDELAKAKSLDKPSATKGGNMGWSAPSAYVEPFAQALAQLKKGEWSKTPVKSPYGYHIIKVEDTRDLKFPSIEEIKPNIIQKLQEKNWEAYTASLRKKAKVK